MIRPYLRFSFNCLAGGHFDMLLHCESERRATRKVTLIFLWLQCLKTFSKLENLFLTLWCITSNNSDGIWTLTYMIHDTYYIICESIAMLCNFYTVHLNYVCDMDKVIYCDNTCFLNLKFRAICKLLSTVLLGNMCSSC